MAVRINNNIAKTMLDALVDSIDAGTGPGYVEIRSGAAPTNCEDVSTGTLGATCTMSDPAFGAATDANPGATAAAAAITPDSSIDASITAGHFRVFDSNNVCVLQGAAAVSGSDMNINSVALSAGAEFAIDSMVVNLPEVAP